MRSAGLLLVSVAGGVAFAVSTVLGALMTGSPIDLAVVAVHLVIAAICFALLGYFLRAAATRRSH